MSRGEGLPIAPHLHYPNAPPPPPTIDASLGVGMVGGVKATFIALLAFSLCLPVVGADKKPLIGDPIVEKAVRQSLKKPSGELTKADYEKVTRLKLKNNQLTEVPKSLEKLTGLTNLDLGHNQLSDVKGLEKLTNLEFLELNKNQLSDLKGLDKLTKLKLLKLDDNQLTSVGEVEKLTQLKAVDLGRNPDLTKAQIDQLQKALPKCTILSDFD